MIQEGQGCPIRLCHIQGWIQWSMICAVTQSPMFDLMLCCYYLEIISVFEQGVLHFHFVLGPTNYVVCPGHVIWKPHGKAMLDIDKETELEWTTWPLGPDTVPSKHTWPLQSRLAENLANEDLQLSFFAIKLSY